MPAWFLSTGTPRPAGQLPCSLPTSVSPARCPDSIWDTSVAPEPLSPVEPGKTELLPTQHSSRWQRDMSKVMQGHRGRLREGQGCILTSCADFRALSGPVARDHVLQCPAPGCIAGVSIPGLALSHSPSDLSPSLPPAALPSQAHRGDRHLWEPCAYQGGSHRFLHLHEQEGEADWQGRVQGYGQGRELLGTRSGDCQERSSDLIQSCLCGGEARWGSWGSASTAFLGAGGQAILQPEGEQETWASAVWGTFLLSLRTNRRIAGLFSTITWYKCQEC